VQARQPGLARSLARGQRAEPTAYLKPPKVPSSHGTGTRGAFGGRLQARRRSTLGRSWAKSSLLGQAARAASRSAPDQSRASGDIAAYWRRASARMPWCS
jgi:hypothetical protein